MKDDPARVAEMSDEELYQALIDNNIPAGPILPSTRGVYEAKLIDALLNSSRSSNEDLDVSFSPVKTPALRASLAASAKQKQLEAKLAKPVEDVEPAPFVRFLTGASAKRVMLDPAPTARRVMLNAAPTAKSNTNINQAHRMLVVKSVVIVGVGVLLAIMLAFVWRSADPYEVLEREVKQLVDRMAPGKDGYE